ncbi:hypothetical protein DFH09DRAFT_1080131 [Mycena vulgaris]|nr:hypothetical protein DFH09DRAFT_1080131 [Mycena vulgaris]
MDNALCSGGRDHFRCPRGREKCKYDTSNRAPTHRAFDNAKAPASAKDAECMTVDEDAVKNAGDEDDEDRNHRLHVQAQVFESALSFKMTDLRNESAPKHRFTGVQHRQRGEVSTRISEPREQTSTRRMRQSLHFPDAPPTPQMLHLLELPRATRCGAVNASALVRFRGSKGGLKRPQCKAMLNYLQLGARRAPVLRVQEYRISPLRSARSMPQLGVMSVPADAPPRPAAPFANPSIYLHP